MAKTIVADMRLWLFPYGRCNVRVLNRAVKESAAVAVGNNTMQYCGLIITRNVTVIARNIDNKFSLSATLLATLRLLLFPYGFKNSAAFARCLSFYADLLRKNYILSQILSPSSRSQNQNF